MSSETIIVIVALVALIAVLAARRGGPRVTEINRTVTRNKEGEE